MGVSRRRILRGFLPIPAFIAAPMDSRHGKAGRRTSKAFRLSETGSSLSFAYYAKGFGGRVSTFALFEPTIAPSMNPTTMRTFQIDQINTGFEITRARDTMNTTRTSPRLRYVTPRCGHRIDLDAAKRSWPGQP